MDQRFDHKNSLNYDRDGRLAPGEAEISDFHDYRSETYKPPLLNTMQQAQVDGRLQLLPQNATCPCNYFAFIFSLFLIINMPFNFKLLLVGVYPYHYMDDFERFEEQFLPLKEQFYNTLPNTHITDSDYLHAKNVFNKFEGRNLGDHHDLYITKDVLILADVFEAFRDTYINHYGLDPTRLYTSPGLAWQSTLKMTDNELELLTDNDIHLFIERELRGGVVTITHHYARASNPLLDNYNPSKVHKYIIYLDTNNLLI